MGTYTHHEPCSRCGSRNNLARYSDGGAFCFGCGYVEQAGISPFVKEREYVGNTVEGHVVVPDDVGFDFTAEVVNWLGKYDISVEEAIKANIKWSPSWEQLTFIFTDENNNVLFTQARNFNPERARKRKYYNQGSPKDVLPIFHGPGERNPAWCEIHQHSKWCEHNGGVMGLSGWERQSKRQLVITEDALSSLKISRQVSSMPALGTHLPARKLSALRTLGYQTLLVWLDSDKWKEAVEIATMAKWLGLSARTIYTELDPKEYSDGQIRRHIEGMAN